MTDQEYNDQMSSLLQRHQANLDERKRLDAELAELRMRRDNPSFNELLEQKREENKTEENPQGIAKRD